MGNVAYMSLFDNSRRQVEGSCGVTDRRGCIEVKKIDYNLSRNFDSQTGKQHSARRHQPFSILKVIDRSSPNLFQCCATGSLLSQARIDLYHINGEGREDNYFSYLLENLHVVSITPVIDSMADGPDMEAISFSFERITFSFNEGNIVASDSWNER
jgi:type VI secretion system secreted protein Hcp